MLLVVGTHQAIDVNIIPWTTLNGVLLIRAVEKTGTFDTKHRLRVHTSLHNIPLHIAFVIPPVEVGKSIPDDLMTGYGLLYDKEVILYDRLCNTMSADVVTKSEVATDCERVH